jgi:hypothetical protein
VSRTRAQQPAVPDLALRLVSQAPPLLIELLKPQLGREQARVGGIGLPVRAEWLGGSGKLGQGLVLQACDLVLEQPQSTALGGLSMHGTTAG